MENKVKVVVVETDITPKDYEGLIIKSCTTKVGGIKRITINNLGLLFQRNTAVFTNKITKEGREKTLVLVPSDDFECAALVYGKEYELLIVDNMGYEHKWNMKFDSYEYTSGISKADFRGKKLTFKATSAL